MVSHNPIEDLIEIFGALSEVPFQYKTSDEVFKRITELTKEAMGSHTCTLALIDLDKKTLVQVACTSSDREMEMFLTGKEYKLGHRQEGHHVDIDVVKEGNLIETYDLQIDGRGVANPEVARKYNLNSLLSYPLWSNGELTGYINHFSSGKGPFTEEEKRKLQIFALQAMIASERIDYHQTLNKLVTIIKDISKNLFSIPPSEFLSTVSAKACELLSVPICIIWKYDSDQSRLRIVATAGDVDKEYEKLEISLNEPKTRNRLFSKNVSYLLDVSKSASRLVHAEEIKRRGWVSVLTAPLKVGEDFIGMLDVFTKAPRRFKAWEKDIFQTFAYHAAVAFQKTELLRANEEKKKLQKLSELMLELSEADNVNELLKLLLEGSFELVESRRGWISLLDYGTGYLNIVADSGDVPRKLHLKYGEGITGLAIEQEMALRADDVREPGWDEIYAKCWEDTRSELAIPIQLTWAQVRVGREIKFRSKPIGVLNIESPHPNAFSQTDEDCLWSLACYAAVMIERLEFDRKLNDLRQIEKEIADVPDFDRVINTLMRGITETLGFEYVNISLVVPDLNSIRTEHVIGMDKQQEEAFKKMASHSLDSDDIQADIVRSKEIEVPDATDRRLDPSILKKFRHDLLVRVFLPMIESSGDRVIGTVETGYKREYRKHIYERDVQILKSFVDYTANALQKKKYGLLDKVSHEFKTPLVGIRSHSSFLQRRIRELDNELVQRKFDDIITDCDLLLYQVGELEYILGRPRKRPKLEKTLVYRDIIIKIIKQLKPIISHRGFDVSRVEYKTADISRISVITDRTKLNQVVYNLLINSIKYAENDPRSFTIRLELDDNKENFILKFKDWGIGIKQAYVEKIFEDGFRTPEAIEKDVSGSGLGLTISRLIMQHLGGDLILANNFKPTEFHLLLPKRTKGDSR